MLGSGSLPASALNSRDLIRRACQWLGLEPWTRLSVSRNGSLGLMGHPPSGPSMISHGSFMAESAAAPAASKVEAARIVRMQKPVASLANPARGSLSNLKKPTGNLKSPLKCQCPRYGPPGPALQWQWRRLRGGGCGVRTNSNSQFQSYPETDNRRTEDGIRVIPGW